MTSSLFSLFDLMLYFTFEIPDTVYIFCGSLLKFGNFRNGICTNIIILCWEIEREKIFY